jgi:uncharacterized protein YkwD
MLKRRLTTRTAAAGIAAVCCLAQPAAALDVNSFRAQHRLPRLHASAELMGAAYAHAHDLAGRNRLDHDGFRSRMRGHSMAAENVAMIACGRPDAKPVSTFAGRPCGCDSEDCVIRMWARSPGHRRNMLMKGVTHYGLASARAANGRTYWVLELGN